MSVCIPEKHVKRAMGILRSKGEETKLMSLLPKKESPVEIPLGFQEIMSRVRDEIVKREIKPLMDRAIQECVTKAVWLNRCYCGQDAEYVTEWMERCCKDCWYTRMAEEETDAEYYARIYSNLEDNDGTRSECCESEIEEEEYDEYLNRKLNEDYDY
jgi:hypothetical protein